MFMLSWVLKKFRDIEMCIMNKYGVIHMNDKWIGRTDKTNGHDG